MSMIDDITLLKLAEAEILGEAKRAAIRHSVAGVSGWQPCPKPNKTFLTNTLLQTIASNRKISRKHSEKKEAGDNLKKTERKLLQKNSKNERTDLVYQKPIKMLKKSGCVAKSKNKKISICKPTIEHKQDFKKLNIKFRQKK